MNIGRMRLRRAFVTLFLKAKDAGGFFRAASASELSEDDNYAKDYGYSLTTPHMSLHRPEGPRSEFLRRFLYEISPPISHVERFRHKRTLGFRACFS